LRGRKYRTNLASIFANEIGGFIWIDFLLLSKRIIVELTQQGEIAGKELFYKSKLSLTPKRKVASYVGRLCEEGRLHEKLHGR
jgi:hypothetical protein